MKQSFARQHSHHRDRTPSIIYLPPPKPPIAAKLPMEAVPEAAMVLPEDTEPLVIEKTAIRAPQTPRLNRQARRKALRAEAKALRREGHVPERIAQSTPPAAAPTVEATPAAIPAKRVAAAAAKSETVKPLPRARSLVTAKPRGFALFAHRLRAVFGLKRATPKQAEATIAGQQRTLRNDLVALQQSIDRMIDGVAA